MMGIDDMKRCCVCVCVFLSRERLITRGAVNPTSSYLCQEFTDVCETRFSLIGRDRA